MRWRYKFILQEKWGDVCYKRKWKDWTYSIAPDWPLTVMCWFSKHNVIDDQCGIPEHRFCLYCNRPTPNQPVTPWEKK